MRRFPWISFVVVSFVLVVHYVQLLKQSQSWLPSAIVERYSFEPPRSEQHMKETFSLPLPKHPKTSIKKPLNILLLYPDDWRHDTIEDERPNLIHTPFLSELAREGIRFTHNAVTSSVCWLSRATLFTGRYASQHNAQRPFCPTFTNHEWWKRTWPYKLQKAGYWVGHIGKWQYRNDQLFLKNAFNFSRFHEGDHWFTVRDNITREKTGLIHAADLAKDDAIAFLQERPKDRPFAMTVAFYPPKAVGSGTQPGAQWSPNETFYEMYKDHVFEPPYNITTAFKSIPEFLKVGISRSRYEQRYNSSLHYTEAMKRYFALVTQVDEASRQIVEELKRQNMYDNTLIVFTSDNGLLQGAHGLAGKWSPYEESIRVPLIIRDPRMQSSVRGTLNNDMTLNVDLARTILGAANVKASNRMQGGDISDLYTSKASSLVNTSAIQPKKAWRQDFYYELPLEQFPDSTALVTKEWKYMYWPSKDYEQLFHIAKDPYELNDLLRNDTTTHFTPDFLEKVTQLLRERYKQVKESAITLRHGDEKPICSRRRKYDGS